MLRGVAKGDTTTGAGDELMGSDGREFWVAGTSEDLKVG
jgi:hypothetical protein